jgi:hypothetical protein
MARIRVLTAHKIKQNLKPGMYADGLGLYLKELPMPPSIRIISRQAFLRDALPYFVPASWQPLL